MFCSKCGNELAANANFCNKCGAKQASNNIIDSDITSDSNESISVAGDSFFAKNSKIIIILAALVAIAIIAVQASVAIVATHPLMHTQRALDNHMNSLTQRIQTTPFYAAVLFADMIDNSTLDISFSQGSGWGSTSGNLTFMMNNVSHEYGLQGQVFMGGMPISFQSYLDRNRIAVQSDLLGNDFLGINLNSFRAEFAPLGSMLGMSQWQINELADYFEVLRTAMAMETGGFEGSLRPYIELLTDAFTNAEVFARDETIQIGNNNVNVRRIEYHFAQDHLANILAEVYALLTFEDFINNNALPQELIWEINSSMLGFINFIENMQREVSDITYVLYIGSGDRIVRDILQINPINEINNSVIFQGDYGTSDDDPWVMTVQEGFEPPMEVFRWSVNEGANNFHNSLFIVDGFGLGFGFNNIFLDTTLNPSNGNFTISYSDNWRGDSISGNFTHSNNSFRLRVDDHNFSFNIEATPGTRFEPVEFLPISQFSMEALQNLFWGFMFGF